MSPLISLIIHNKIIIVWLQFYNWVVIIFEYNFTTHRYSLPKLSGRVVDPLLDVLLVLHFHCRELLLALSQWQAVYTHM